MVIGNILNLNLGVPPAANKRFIGKIKSLAGSRA